MARPVKRRRICCAPRHASFGPLGKASGQEIELALEEYEAVRLIDLLGRTQEECAAQMGIGRTTVQNIYDRARRKIAAALVCAHRLKIAGGAYEVCRDFSVCACHNCKRQSCKKEGEVCAKFAARPCRGHFATKAQHQEGNERRINDDT